MTFFDPRKILEDDCGSAGGLVFRIIVGITLTYVLWAHNPWPPSKIAWAFGMGIAAALLGMKVAAILLLTVMLARAGFAPPGVHPFTVLFDVVLYLLPGTWAGLIVRDVLIMLGLMPWARSR